MKEFFVVTKGLGGKEMPCKFHDEIPLSEKPNIVWGIRLEGRWLSAPLADLYAEFCARRNAGRLPPSNILSADYFTRM